MSDKHLVELQRIIASTKALLSHLSASTKEDAAPQFGDKPTPNALALASTACALIRAQTTKLSLLVINKPFTPSAISSVLKVLASDCIPALVTAKQLSTASSSSSSSSSPPQSFSSYRYPKVVRQVLSLQTSTLLLEFENLLGEIPVDERGVLTAQNRGRDTLASTGVIWEACDAVIALGEKGATDAAATRASQIHSLVKDAIEELKEWMEGDDDGDSEDAGNHSDGENERDNSSSTDLIMADSCPQHMRKTAEKTLETIEHIRLLFPPITKRRVKKFPALTGRTKAEELPTVEEVERLDTLLDQMQDISEEIDEAAGFLYEDEQEKSESQIGKLADLARQCASSMQKNWEGVEDELATWLTSKWGPSLDSISSPTT